MQWFQSAQFSELSRTPVFRSAVPSGGRQRLERSRPRLARGGDLRGGHGERSRSQLLLKLAGAESCQFWLLTFWLLTVWLLTVPSALYIASKSVLYTPYSVKKVSYTLYIASKSVLLTRSPCFSRFQRALALAVPTQLVQVAARAPSGCTIFGYHSQFGAASVFKSIRLN